VVLAAEIPGAFDVVQRGAVQISATADQERHLTRERLQASLPALRVASFASAANVGDFA
jgi:hypothetical protein